LRATGRRGLLAELLELLARQSNGLGGPPLFAPGRPDWGIAGRRLLIAHGWNLPDQAGRAGRTGPV